MANVFPCKTSATTSKKSVSRASERTIAFVFWYASLQRLQFLKRDPVLKVFAPTFLYEMKCLGQIYEQKCYLKIFCMYSVMSTDSQNLWSYGFRFFLMIFLSYDSTLKKTINRRYLSETMTDYTDDLALLVNTPDKARFQLHSLAQVAGSIRFYVTESSCVFNKKEPSSL